jgi:hypothetical protein
MRRITLSRRSNHINECCNSCGREERAEHSRRPLLAPITSPPGKAQLMNTIPTVGSMLSVIGVALLVAVVLSAIVGALLLRTDAPSRSYPATRRPSRAWRRSWPLATRADAPGGSPGSADAPRLTDGAVRRLADREAGTRAPSAGKSGMSRCGSLTTLTSAQSGGLPTEPSSAPRRPRWVSPGPAAHQSC